jgi:Asp-tRNA(Asn)/Glu-tRNA(Gln) amidotransferase A subunit family amidase
MCPSNRAALYGIKPTVGLVSRAGVIPVSLNQDTVHHSKIVALTNRWVQWPSQSLMPH